MLRTNFATRGIFMNYIKSCEFNIDTACVEVKLTDGSMVSINCIAVEIEYANNMYEMSALDYPAIKHYFIYAHLLCHYCVPDSVF